MSITLDHLRGCAVARSFFKPTTLKRALHKFGFVQADPIRSPARAQDLILRHRVNNYRVGDLERNYAKLGIEEDFFITYGFVTSAIHALMHPRSDAGVPAEGSVPWPRARKKQAQLLLEFVRERGSAHPREVDDHFVHGSVQNYWGGSSNATTHLLSAMHYRGLLRVARRDNGIRIYSTHEHGPDPIDVAERQARLDALVDVAVGIYAPLPGPCLSGLVRRLRFAVPQWHGELKGALQRAKQRLTHTHRRYRLVLAGRGRCGSPCSGGQRCFARQSPIAHPLRSSSLGPRPLRIAVGMGVQVRGLHACSQTQTRLLRDAATLARSHYWVGKSRSEQRQA
jgi:uncharacterized protein